MEDYPSNRREKPRRRDEGPPAQQKKVDKVIQGEVVRRKKPLSRRFGEYFLPGNAKSVWGYIAMDILVPAARDAISDSFHEGFDRLWEGETRGRSHRGRRRSGGSGYVSYNNYSRRDNRDEPRNISRRGRSNHDFDEIILSTRVEAEEVVDRLFDLVAKFEIATVSDLYDMVGITANPTDEKWGWEDLRGAGVTRIRNGYLLELPRPEPI